MRNLWRIFAFDVAAPLAAVAGLVMLGLVLNWPWWWVMAATAVVLLIVEAVVVNFVLLRRDGVTVGTDDERPALRLVVVALCTVALGAALWFQYKDWTAPDRDLRNDSADVVRVATEISEAAATVSPADPNSSIDRAAAMMAPDRVDAFKESIGRTATDLAYRNIAVQAEPLMAGVEAIGPSAARVVVVMRSTQSVMGQETKQTTVPVRVTLTKRDGSWLGVEIAPIHIR
ncbi:MAG TPA: hypothetical protein VFR27_19530 [Mycobacterium sp.]|nr:hypothetical protein [Mycobacterium sp.]